MGYHIALLIKYSMFFEKKNSIKYTVFEIIELIKKQLCVFKF